MQHERDHAFRRLNRERHEAITADVFAWVVPSHRRSGAP